MYVFSKNRKYIQSNACIHHFPPRQISTEILFANYVALTPYLLLFKI